MCIYIYIHIYIYTYIYIDILLYAVLTPIGVLTNMLTESHDPPSTDDPHLFHRTEDSLIPTSPALVEVCFGLRASRVERLLGFCAGV